MKLNEKSKGLGDTIKKITSATKIDKLAKKIAQVAGADDCGCDERQEKLNKLFPYKPNDSGIATEIIQECILLWEDIKTGIAKNHAAKKKMITLYNKIYKTNYKTNTTCSTCLNDCFKGIKRIYEKYK